MDILYAVVDPTDQIRIARHGASRSDTSLEVWQAGVRARQRGLWGDAFHRLSRNKFAMAGLIILIAVIALAILGNYVDAVQRYDPRVQEFERLQSRAGTTGSGLINLGRDNWSRTLQGLWVSLRVGIGVAIVVLSSA